MAALVSPAAPASAHHSDGHLEELGEWILVKGTVTAYRWSHPHVTLLVDVAGANGMKTRYTIVLPSPQEIRRAKEWTQATFRAGDPLEMKVYPASAREGECTLRCLVYLNEALLPPRWERELLRGTGRSSLQRTD
jgi:hypothetical protein